MKTEPSDTSGPEPSDTTGPEPSDTTGTEATDPVAAADAVVAAVDPGLNAPGVQSRDVVLVTGPWLAGTSSLVALLAERLPDHTFVESGDLAAAEAPAAVVFVTSASTPLTESDCALADLATQHTDLVVGVVSKIDTHQGWRDVLAADQALLSARAPRYRRMPWVGVAAAPDLGEPNVDELVELLTGRLGHVDVKHRNRLRAWETRLESVIERYRADGAGEDRAARVSTLRKRREEILSARRLEKTERTIALRSQIQQARVQLAYFARNRCASLRTELQEDIGDWGSAWDHVPFSGARRRKLENFESYVRERCGQVTEEVDEGITKHLGDVATELELAAPNPGGKTDDPSADKPADEPEVSPPPLESRRLESRLMVLLGGGFGLGVALAVSRLFTGAAPGLTVAGLALGAVIGLVLAAWLVGIRTVLHDRAVLDRWVGEVTSALRSKLEERVGTRVVAAEAELTSELATRDEADGKLAADQVGEIDTELREHGVSTARAAALRDRRMPTLQRALAAVRQDLYGDADKDVEESPGDEPEASEGDEAEPDAEISDTEISDDRDDSAQ